MSSSVAPPSGAAPPPSAAPPPELALIRLITGHWFSQALHAVAALGVADALHAGARPAEELAAELGADARALHRVLRSLAAVGVFAEDDAGRFALTPLADLLRSGRPGSLRDLAIVNGSEWYRAWSEFPHAVRTGEPAWDRAFGQSLFAFLASHPEAGRAFDAAMSGVSEGAAPAIAAAVDFSGAQTVVDVAGGRGSQLAAILRANPTLHGVLFDLPPVIESGPPLAADPELADRVTCRAGSFFEEVPGGDVLLLRNILHDWDDARARQILERCRRALSDGGRLLVIEAVVEPGNAPSFAKLLDLHMLVIGGCERTEAEYRALLAAAGFALTKLIPTASPLSVLEAVPV